MAAKPQRYKVSYSYSYSYCCVAGLLIKRKTEAENLLEFHTQLSFGLSETRSVQNRETKNTNLTHRFSQRPKLGVRLVKLGRLVPVRCFWAQ